MLRQVAAEEGRTLDARFPVCVYLDINVNTNEARAMEDAILVCRRDGRTATAEMLGQSAGIGSLETCLRFIRGYIASGATHVALRPVASDLQGQIESLRRLIAPELKSVVI